LFQIGWDESICIIILIKVSQLIFSFLKRLPPFGTKLLSLLINPRRLAPKYFEYFIGSAPPTFILDPLLWIGSAYLFLYINPCNRFNKTLTNLTSLCQHQLQYKGKHVPTDMNPVDIPTRLPKISDFI
jgi:hypothetical protein